MNEWISVKDRLPEEGQVILCLLSGTNKIIRINNYPLFPQKVLIYTPLGKKGPPLFLDQDFGGYNPTHWMPLPESPK